MIRQSTRQQLESLIAIAASVAGAHRLEDVLEVAARRAREALGAGMVAISRWEAEEASWDSYRDQASREAPLELRGVVDIPGDPLLAWVNELSFTDRDAGAVHFVAKAEIKRPPQ